MDTDEHGSVILRRTRRPISEFVSKRRYLISYQDGAGGGSGTSDLKGSHNSQGKHRDSRQKRMDGDESAERNEMGCFKCGETGHWARDCPSSKGNASSLFIDSTGDDEDDPYKECPCGGGRCLVNTSRTLTNPGRRFFGCPLRSELGGCNFFEWCDTPQTQNGDSNKKARTDQANPSVPTRTDLSSCFKCGAQGHWARDCLDQSTRNKISSSLSGFQTCFKCGDSGHWSRNCPAKSSRTSRTK